MKKYIRDGRAPIPKNEKTSIVMSSNKGKDSKPELILRKALWNSDLKGYRLHWKKAPGKPDIAYPGKKIAIFVNGCFWHRCPHCQLELPKSNTDFWRNKFQKNLERDAKTNLMLEKTGWNVLVFWECQIKNDVVGLVTLIRKHIITRVN